MTVAPLTKSQAGLVVTGGNGSAGWGMARGLERAHAEVVAAACDAGQSQAAVADLGAQGAKASAFGVDVTEAESIAALISQVKTMAALPARSEWDHPPVFPGTGVLMRARRSGRQPVRSRAGPARRRHNAR